MIEPGNIVLVKFPGSVTTKIRLALVISSREYHQTRPDVILGILTSQINQAVSPSDYCLKEWQTAGLDKPTAFRSYLITVQQPDIKKIGQLTTKDWEGIQSCLRHAIHID